MTQMRERAIAVIKKHPKKRERHELDYILPWLSKTAQILNGIDKRVLIEIVARCAYMKANRDSVIITQGEKGDSFYVILDGSVSVYIDSTKSGEEECNEMLGSRSNTQKTASNYETNTGGKDVISTTEVQPRGNTPKSSSSKKSKVTFKLSEEAEKKEEGNDEEENVMFAKKPLDRSKYGKYVIKFGPGRCFGEIALISEENVRNASIICDEESDFLVIHRDLYNQTLKNSQEQEFLERRHFVNTSPIFKKWSRKFKRLLEMSLIKEVYTFDTPIIKQGDQWNGLIFIIKGRAQVTVEPNRHKSQYKSMEPFIDHDDVYEVENLRPPAMIEKAKTRKKNLSKKSIQLEEVLVRRKDGYVAAEKRRQSRNINLCAVSEGEMFGDTELVMGMETYSYSVKCTTETAVYILTAKNCERLINKKNPATMDFLKMIVQTKLKTRLHTPQGQQIPLLKHLLYRLNTVEREPPKDIPPLKGTKGLPEKEVLFDHLLAMYKSNRAALIKPLIPGGIYYREMMKEKAKVREAVRLGQMNNPILRKKLHVVRKPPCKRARTERELKQALSRQNEDAEGVERRMILEQIRELEEEGIAQEFEKVQAAAAAKAKAEEAARLKAEAEERAKKEKEEQEKAATTEVKEMRTEKPRDNVLPKLPPITPKRSGTSRRAMSREKSRTFVSDLASEPGDLLKAREGTQTENFRDTHSAHGDLEYEDSLPDIDVDNYVDDDTSRSPNRREKARMTFLNSIIRQKINAAPENPRYRDWETSEHSIRYLEERVRNFTTKTGKIVGQPPPARLPKLQRFQAGDDVPNQPKPGGKVFVRKSTCILKNLEQQVKDHSHERFRMVDKLSDYDEMKRSKMVQHLVLDHARDKWIHNQSLP
ncbi:hypothetical protein CAPTEDRAFT_209368 [Capitella teleta]|uniref:Cyclic nucleotide-binding domain-containing protein n=1 Tax=Capitella teleta TaxID=283909 RepID=R7TME6_CAPTE|nr:hypothetical protein CAPTEDRAFT_209368 [Capitella teleta]|eukprot:ELT94707.1 hypothetical protein CAPTEDRAFT_209368 [Capitella teleta]